jgi:hypothetical protein
MCPMLLHASGGYGSNFLDVTQLVQRYLKDAGIEAELKLEAPGVWRVSGPDHVRIVHTICSYKSPRASRSPFDKSGAGGGCCQSLQTQEYQCRVARFSDDRRRQIRGAGDGVGKNYAPNLLLDHTTAAELWLDRYGYSRTASHTTCLPHV